MVASLFRGTAIVSILTLLSRILGFARDLIVAHLFGSSRYADAFFVAFRIPNLLRSLFAEGALTAAFVPTFTDEVKKGPDAAQLAFSSILKALLCATTIATLLGILFAPEIVTFISPGYKTQPESFDLTVLLTRIMFIYIIFVSVVVLINGALNAYLVFGASAWAQVLMNLVLIVGGLIAFLPNSHRLSTIILASSVVVGGIVQLVAQLPALHRVGLKLALSGSMLTPAVRTTARLMIPAAAGAGVYQITVMLSTILASLLNEGAIASLYYADRVTQLPLGIISVALASVLLPLLAKLESSGDKAGASTQLNLALCFSSFVMIPLSVFLITDSVQIVKILFERGAFTSTATQDTAKAVSALAYGIWSVSCTSLFARAFMAQKLLAIPVHGALLALVVATLCALTLMGPPVRAEAGTVSSLVIALQYSLPFKQNLGISGLALASAVGSFASLGYLVYRYVRATSAASL